MHVNHDGDAVHGPFDRFPVGALEVGVAVGSEGEVGSGEASSQEGEGGRA